MLELRILIVGAPEALVQALGEEYRLSYSCLRDLTEMEQALEQSWDFLLLSESPFEPFLSPALRRKLPSIVVAEPEQENEAIALVDAGASDYVIRGDWRRLRSIIRRLRRDTSSMKNMTEKVNESEYRYRTLFKNSCAVMLLIEPGSRRIVDCNSAACSFYGYSEAEMRGKDLFEINMHSPEQLSRDIEMVENQQCQRYYFPHRLASGEIRQVEVFSLPIQIEKKNYLYSIVLDITERKKIEENLRLAEARNRGILNALPDRLLFLDSEGVCIDYRATKSDSLAFPAEAFLGKRVTEVVPPEVAELISATLEAVRTLGEVQTVEYYISTVHGERRYFETRIAPTPAGEFVSLARDITARRGVEEELIYSKEAAEIANRAKSEFLTNMSHEIRTPLNGIFGLTELALGTALSQEQRDYLQLIKASADSLRTVIDDVLDFSKIEAGKLSLDSIPLSLRECVATLRTFLPQALEKGLQLAWYVRAEVPDALVGDPMRLRQILVNLIGNAIKFTPEGEVIVMVELDSLDEKEAVLHFSVSDSGIGIPENKRKSIFDSFEQADTSMSRRYG
ncbi:MAG TPA: hypothetical protein DD435_10755, partial [Cyanobacteria bacterium UBA8530]|nr:hypothetical protein [Cyanobacteria bacterium UBA8530]